MSRNQAKHLRSLITRHVNAQINLSWAGGGDPALIPEIKATAAKAAEALNMYIATIAILGVTYAEGAQQVPQHSPT